MPCIAIDTNVFEHLLNPGENTDSHIDRLLGALTQASYQLLVDSTSKIAKEYIDQIIPVIRNADETRPQLPLLRHWMNPDIRCEVRVERNGGLMNAIRHVIVEVAEHADRAFVYVVCCEDATLVTNDEAHILSRRGSLLQETKRMRGKNTDIKSSSDAAEWFGEPGGS